VELMSFPAVKEDRSVNTFRIAVRMRTAALLSFVCQVAAFCVYPSGLPICLHVVGAHRCGTDWLAHIRFSAAWRENWPVL
jgi:hypothetical protein